MTTPAVQANEDAMAILASSPSMLAKIVGFVHDAPSSFRPTDREYAVTLAAPSSPLRATSTPLDLVGDTPRASAEISTVPAQV